MSDVSVDIIKNRNGEAPDLPSGANLSGVSTAATLQVTNLNPTHINASGVTTATTFSGSFKSTSTPTLGLGVTINSSGINISGVATAGIVSATTLYGDGSNLTGVAMSIAPISYQPDVNDTLVTKSGVSIGMTFTQRVIAGSGNITLRIAGAGGTVVENFGVGNSVTINNNTVSFTPTADLATDTVYHINYPSGCFTDTSGDVSYVGTAYTFTAAPTAYQLWMWGDNQVYAGGGVLGQNQGKAQLTAVSSPVQVPGTNWSTNISSGMNGKGVLITKTDGTLWSWGYQQQGMLGLNDVVGRSSPTQIPGTTWHSGHPQGEATAAIKTDGTLWVWGRNVTVLHGRSQPDNVRVSSPVQVGSDTTWQGTLGKFSFRGQKALAIKTDGTLWTWGHNQFGDLGQNNHTHYSSPIQIGSDTTWSVIAGGQMNAQAVKTDGTLWSWGANDKGQQGLNISDNPGRRSSPTQIGSGTDWSTVSLTKYHSLAIKTNGTMWAWGRNNYGQLAQNNNGPSDGYSSPVQIPGTTWSQAYAANGYNYAKKTDGSIWAWGSNSYGILGQNNLVQYSSPVQVPGTSWGAVGGGESWASFIKEV